MVSSFHDKLGNPVLTGKPHTSYNSFITKVLKDFGGQVVVSFKIGLGYNFFSLDDLEAYWKKKQNISV